MELHEMIRSIMQGQTIDPGQLSTEEFTNLIRGIVLMDQLTGISNASGLHGFAGRMQAMHRMHEYDGYFLNIKSMRIINEKWGRTGGDQVLIQFAQKLKELTYPDGFVARMGGDNFFAFVNRNNREYFISNVKRIKMHLKIDGEVWMQKVETRMGMYEIQNDELGTEAMEAASMALQFIRTSSDQQLSVYTPQMKERDFQAKQLKDSFKDALSNKEFVPYYQPKVNIHTGKICGAEALARWFHEGTMIPPGIFVPILEHTGAVCKLDYYMLDCMCEDLKRWIGMGLTPVRISCNFSKKHLATPRFAENIIDIIKSHKMDPKYIEIELTESYEADDRRALEAFITKMQANGIRTSIDDFGNAYSSLNLLKDMKAETVKIDKSLIDNVGKGSREDDAIVDNIAKLLLDLGKEVVVEGVEDEKQILFLKEHNCHVVQGFYYAKPLPRDEFEKWINM